MRSIIRALGVLNAVLFAGHAALSYVAAGAAGYAERPYGHIAFYTDIGSRISRIVMEVVPEPLLLRFGTGDNMGEARAPAVLRVLERQIAWAIGGDWLGSDRFIDVYAWPLLLSTLVTLGLLLVLFRLRSPPDERHVQQLQRWAYVFVFVMAFALPVLVQDFWLSFAWGRTLWWGGNPYYHVPAAAVAGLPFDDPILRMTYGPLWALVIWGVTALTGGSVLAGAVVFKALLAVAWCVVIWAVAQLTVHRPIRERCAAIALVGWLPLGPVQIGGDGHNDVFMIVGILAWLLLLRRGRTRWATLALALSVSVKYVSAPLFLLDLLHARWVNGHARSWRGVARAYLPNAAIAVAVWTITFWPFLDSLSFFRETAAVREGHFYLPSDAILGIGRLLSMNLMGLAYATMAVFPVVTLVFLWRYWRQPGPDTRHGAAAAIMMTVLFVAAGHVWPWYVLWLFVLAATLPLQSGVSRFATGVAMAMPVVLLYWVAYPDASEFRRFQGPSLFAYGAALAWMLVGWRVVTGTGWPRRAR